MINPLHTASLFLVNTIFDLYLLILVVRIILVYAGLNYFDPITQFIVKCTDFLVKPLRRRLLPTIGGFELASIVWVIIIASVKFILISLLSIGIPNMVGILILAIADLFKLVLQTFFYAIILQAILSWFQPYSPLTRSLSQITAPVMRPFRRLIPLINGIDISPIPALIVLQLLSILLISPLMALGFAIAFG